ncbi:hypothetical protein YC2023_019741 [Brassica napus]
MVDVLSRRGCTTVHDLETERGIGIEVSRSIETREKMLQKQVNNLSSSSVSFLAPFILTIP